LNPAFEWVPVSRIEEVAEDTFVISYAEPKNATAIQAGQFCMVSSSPGSSDFYLPRPFSYYQVLAPHTIRILFRIFGRATRWMAALKPGDKIGVFGPLGRAFTSRTGAQRAILVAGGIGLPPLVLLAGKLARLDKAPVIDLVYGEVKGARVIDLKGTLPETVRCHIATEDGQIGFKGLVTQVLEKILSGSETPPAVYTCGPKAMMAAVSDILQPEKVELFEASLEENMACGMGICQGCVIPIKAKDGAERYECCCTEGPVFNGFEVKWR